MRAFLGALVLALLMAVTAGCVYTWFNYDGSTPNPAVACKGSYGAGFTEAKGTDQ
jgi:hypothetical protein